MINLVPLTFIKFCISSSIRVPISQSSAKKRSLMKFEEDVNLDDNLLLLKIFPAVRYLINICLNKRANGKTIIKQRMSGC